MAEAVVEARNLWRNWLWYNKRERQNILAARMWLDYSVKVFWIGGMEEWVEAVSADRLEAKRQMRLILARCLDARID